MKVNSQSNKQAQIQQSETARSQNSASSTKAQKAGAAQVQNKGTSSAERAEVSGRAKEMAQARDLAKSSPDVREDRVAELKKKISSGEYKVDADAVADRMIREHLQQS